MRAIDGAVSRGAEVRTFWVPGKTDGAPFAVQLLVAGREVVTYYAETSPEAMRNLEEYLGRSAVTSLEQKLERENTPPASVRVDDVLDAGGLISG